MPSCHTFIVHAQIVLRQSNVAKLVFGAPGAGERCFVFINGWIEPSESLVELFFLLVQSRVSVDNNRHQKPTACRLSRHGFGATFWRCGLSGTSRNRRGLSVSSFSGLRAKLTSYQARLKLASLAAERQPEQVSRRANLANTVSLASKGKAIYEMAQLDISRKKARKNSI